VKNQEIAKIFNEIADMLEIKEENPFRIRAYRRAAMNIEGLSENIEEIAQEEVLQIPGIGHDLAAKINEYLRTGRIQIREELSRAVPEGLLPILSVPGLGPKTAKLLYEKLNIRTLDELERFAAEHKLVGAPGIKEKTEENIRKGIEMLRRGRERQPLGKVLPIAQDILDQLKKHASITKIDIAGSLRRWKDTVKDIDIVATSDNPKEVMKVFTHLPHARDVLLQGPTKSSIITHEGLQVDLRVVEQESYGAALAYFTGSMSHNVRLREMAVKRGLKINEYGIFREKDGKRLGGRHEDDIYRTLGLPYIQPELRENQGEIEAAMEGTLPQVLSRDDMRGDLHVHSQWSDGRHTFEQLVEAAMQCRYEYIALTDHSKGLAIAHGLTVERLLEQGKEVAALNKKLRGFKILRGTEVDIRSDGSLDLPDDALKTLDIVVASIHSGFKQPKQQLTLRLLSAMKNPYVSIVAHPTGRLIGERDAYELDMEAVLRMAKETGTALEINAYPLRLDLNDTYARRAKLMGVPIVISTDTHLANQMDYMRYGVSIARRSWLGKDDVVNTLPLKKLLKRLKPGINKQPI